MAAEPKISGITSKLSARAIVYVGSEDDNVYALNATTGAYMWSFMTGSAVYSSPAVAEGTVFIGSTDDNIYALDASTGAYLWSYTTGDAVHSSPAVANGVVYVGSVDDNVYAFGVSSSSGFNWSSILGYVIIGTIVIIIIAVALLILSMVGGRKGKF